MAAALRNVERCNLRSRSCRCAGANRTDRRRLGLAKLGARNIARRLRGGLDAENRGAGYLQQRRQTAAIFLSDDALAILHGDAAYRVHRGPAEPTCECGSKLPEDVLR